MTRYTFGSDEERERWELDHIAAAEGRLDTAETTITDHETRIDTLESGGGGGGMAEEMYARFGASVAAGPGDGDMGGDWALDDSFGTDTPTLWASDESYLLIAAAGYHLLTATVGTNDTLDPGEEFALELAVSGTFNVITPFYVETGLGVSMPRRETRLTLPMHLEPPLFESNGLTFRVWHRGLTAERDIYVELGVSRIGASVAGAEAYPLA